MTDTVHVHQTPETVIHTILKSAQATETNALNLLKHSQVKTTWQRNDVMKIMERCLPTHIKDLHQQYTPASVAILHEAVNEQLESEVIWCIKWLVSPLSEVIWLQKCKHSGGSSKCRFRGS